MEIEVNGKLRSQMMIRQAYPNVVLIEDDKGIFDSSGNAVTIVQSNVDAARVELNKLNYQYQRTNLETGYPSIGAQLDQLYHDIKVNLVQEQKWRLVCWNIKCKNKISKT